MGCSNCDYDPDGSGTTNMELRSEPQDAILFVSGYEIHSDSNTVSNAIEGVTLTLKAPTEQGSTVSLAVERDDAASRLRQRNSWIPTTRSRAPSGR